MAKTSEVRSRARAIVATVFAAALCLSAPQAATAATWHQNTDPYNTGCTSSKSQISSRNVPGGTLTVWASSTCGTNWIEYYGSSQTVNKRVYSDETNGGGWTQWENDTAGWSYSMQAYAPGTTYIEAVAVVSGVTYRAVCGAGCTWR